MFSLFSDYERSYEPRLEARCSSSVCFYTKGRTRLGLFVIKLCSKPKELNFCVCSGEEIWVRARKQYLARSIPTNCWKKDRKKASFCLPCLRLWKPCFFGWKKREKVSEKLIKYNESRFSLLTFNFPNRHLYELFKYHLKASNRK